ncbi:MAG: hypothetical protein SGJ02_08355 [bacterium]|nr:hypothetical protein [bacterium]
MVSTEDPPRQRWNAAGLTAWLVRPLFDVQEADIIKWRDTAKIEVEGSGCGHGMTELVQTPRELIHRRIIRGINKTSRDLLCELLSKGLNTDGTLKINTRNTRNSILGDYRPATTKI